MSEEFEDFKLTDVKVAFGDLCGQKYAPRPFAQNVDSIYYRPMILSAKAVYEEIVAVFAILLVARDIVSDRQVKPCLSVLKRLITTYIEIDLDSMGVQVNEVGHSPVSKQYWVALRFFKEATPNNPSLTFTININLNVT